MTLLPVLRSMTPSPCLFTSRDCDVTEVGGAGKRTPYLLRHQAIKASRISGCLNETICSNKYLRNEAKVRIYKSVIRPILTYAAETRTDTSKTMQLLEVTEMQTLRRIINKTRMDKMRNEWIRELCGIENITSWVQRRRTEWNMHISRMAEDRPVRRVHDGIREGKRNRGRPMKRWRDALE